MVQLLGLCRFSYPADDRSFQSQPGDLAKRRAGLYAPARLERRLTWFEHILLPGLAAQTDPDFTLLLLLGDDFPEPYRTRLLDLVAPVPQIRPVFRAPDNHRKVCREIMREARDPAADWVAEFKMDDDDAVAIDYVEHVRRDFEPMRPLAEANGRVALDHQRGLVLQAEGDGVELFPLVARYWGVALALCLRPDDEQAVMDFPHHRVWWRMSSLARHEPFMFVRGSHGTNDSTINLKQTITLPTPPQAVQRTLANRFRIDLPAFRAALRRLEGAGA
ncbi:hypothetical protein OG2516_08526 [Oceanicola granulosus HTCC2516]|uniref:Rhamnosyl transferase n=1 Tax=Oceanicola granulosus (strain ATCC BAA-861 / DSM 15982 / KCTC 12143 / HTCC2516) TaxID=314256 RepID=Q2CBH5_OCEGH|nr:glycosyltransferase [Oceanicola granulosus]EAR50070.1 hypothetical protein OG2516_08526 [Oceanicola granulosus HTCC2516]